MSDGARSLATALVVTAIGLVPLALMVSTPGQQPETPAATTTVVPQTTAVVAAPPVVVTTPPPTIVGVTSEVAAVLAANGFASDETIPGVPESVIALLRERDVVLTIAVTPER